MPLVAANLVTQSRQHLVGEVSLAASDNATFHVVFILLQGRLKRSAPASDVGQLAEVLVVFGKTTFTLADRPDAFDELDRLDPLDHFEAELILDA